MRSIFLIALAASALAACNRTDTLGADRAPQTPAPDAPAAPIPAGQDSMPTTPELPAATTAAGLVARLAQSDMFEVEAGRLALQRSTADPVKAFAQTMVDAHTASSQALQAQVRAARLNIAAPTDLDRPHSDLSATLRSVDAADFDQTYLNQQIEGHEEALALLQGYAANGDNAALRAWATAQALVVQAHLTQARTLAGGGQSATATASSSAATSEVETPSAPATVAPSAAASAAAAPTPAPAPRRR